MIKGVSLNVTIFMMMSSNGNIFRVTGRSPVDSPHKGKWCGALMLSLICAWTKQLSKPSRRRWFETPSRSLWRHCNAIKQEPKWAPFSPTFEKHSNIKQHVLRIWHRRTHFYKGKKVQMFWSIHALFKCLHEHKYLERMVYMILAQTLNNKPT